MQTKFGAFIAYNLNGLQGDSFKLAVAQQLNASILRLGFTLGNDITRITDSPLLDQDKIEVLFNFNFANIVSGANITLPTDMVQYKSDLKNAIEAACCNRCVIENEWPNYCYYNMDGHAKRYIALLQAACEVGQELGTGIIDGAVHSNLVKYQYSLTLSKEDAMDFRIRHNIKITKSIQAGAAVVQEVWAAMKGMDYLKKANIHLYQNSDDAGDIPAIIDYVANTTNKDVIINETGLFAGATGAGMQEMNNAYKSKGIKVVVWYSSTGNPDDSLPLHFSDASLTQLGMLYKNGK